MNSALKSCAAGEAWQSPGTCSLREFTEALRSLGFRVYCYLLKNPKRINNDNPYITLHKEEHFFRGSEATSRKALRFLGLGAFGRSALTFESDLRIKSVEVC